MKAKLLFISLAVMGLSACSSVAQQQAQSPKDWYVLSLQRQFKEDSQYNFKVRRSWNWARLRRRCVKKC